MAAERSSAEQAWRLGGALAVVLAMMAGWFLVVHPELGKAADARDSAAAAQDSNLVLQQRVDTLRAQSAKLSALTGQLRTAYAALPPTSGMDEFTRQLAADAQGSHVRLTSITVGTPTPAGPAAGAAGASSGTPPVAGAPPQAVVGQTYQIGVTVVSSGPERGQQAFLRSVQHDPRAALVTSAALAPPSGVSAAPTAPATLTVQLLVFVEPQSPQDRAALQKLLDQAAHH